MNENITDRESPAPAESAGDYAETEREGMASDDANGTAPAPVEQMTTTPTYAQIAPDLLKNGYGPIPLEPGTKHPAVYDWTKTPTASDVAKWALECPDGGTGLIGGAIVGIDIDVVEQPGLAADLERLTRNRLGETPLLRIGKAPKRVLVYRADVPFRGWKRHPLEVLALGQQFVAFGTHPDTGKPYYWPDQSPLDVPLADLPVVTEDMVRDWLEEAWALIPESLRRKAASPTSANGKPKAKCSPALRRLDDAAMADLLWVENLVPEARHVGGSWRFRPTWGGSDGKGGGLEEMVSLHRDGIWDFGNEVPMTPLELVAAYLEFSQVDAALWLSECLGIEYIPPPSYDEVISIAKALTRDSSPDEIRHALSLVAKMDDDLERGKAESTVKTQTKLKVAVVQGILAEFVAQDASDSDDDPLPKDLGLRAAHLTLNRHYAGGGHLIRAVDHSFWAYNGTHWVRRTDEQVMHDIIGVVAEMVDNKVASTMGSALAVLIAMQAAPGDVLRLAEEPHPVINCQNGELWIGDDGSVDLRPHRPESYLTYVLNCDYDPAATCPTFDGALQGIFANSSDPAEMIRHLNEVVGYMVQPRRHIPSWFLWRGPGANGKSKIMETVEHLVSQDAIYSDRIGSFESSRFAIGSLAGKLILLDEDVDTGTKLPDGFLKKISERKPLTGELKFKPSFSFVATCVPVLLANNYPHTADLSHGMMRRTYVIPFDRKFSGSEKDATLFPRIWKAELPGVLNRAIEGLQRVMIRGEFAEPLDCLKAKDEWMMQANPLVAFLAERTETIPAKDLFPECRWAKGLPDDFVAMVIADGKPVRA